MQKGRDYWSRHIAASRQTVQKSVLREARTVVRDWISKLTQAAAPESQRLVQLEPVGGRA